MTLEPYGEALAYEIALDMALDEPAALRSERLAREVAPKLRALAVIVLLTRGDVSRFHGNLRAAAELWRDYLLAAATEGAQARMAAGNGHAQGLFDALASGSLALAREIARLASSLWREGFEYEDDFCWARIVGLLLEGTPAPAEVDALLERFEGALQGQPSARLELARVLARRDGKAFGVAFEELLREQAHDIRTRVEAGEMDDAASLQARRVFVEGLALLALVHHWELPTERDYRFCPALARVRMLAD